MVFVCSLHVRESCLPGGSLLFIGLCIFNYILASFIAAHTNYASRVYVDALVVTGEFQALSAQKPSFWLDLILHSRR